MFLEYTLINYKNNVINNYKIKEAIILLKLFRSAAYILGNFFMHNCFFEL